MQCLCETLAYDVLSMARIRRWEQKSGLPARDSGVPAIRIAPQAGIRNLVRPRPRLGIGVNCTLICVADPELGLEAAMHCR